MLAELPPKTRKFTVELPEKVVNAAKEYSGKGTTEIIRDLMTDYVRIQAQREVLNLVGSYKPSISIEEMRSWEDD